MVSAATGDDAAVYRIAPDRALVATVDFFTPVVDDPFDFGRIAAANALSDIYAMGARPLFALNLLGFPREHLGQGILEEIVRGGEAVMREAGALVLGGHSVEDPEPKFGYCVVGEVAPADLVTNAGARPGDLLVLTKPIGTGVIATAIKAGVAREDAIMNALACMTTLNRDAAVAMREAAAHAATDVTGYGLLGHLHVMLRASGAAARIHASSVPFLPGAIELAQEGHVPGGTRRNAADRAADVTFERPLPDPVRTLLFDAQTSGGLLIAVAPDLTQRLTHALGRLRAPASAIIGEVREGTPGSISVVP